ncbi:MAG TPA: FMN-binding protein [Acidimicrobiales bacterium]|nr:FMN-binding protein [Acidimicrobiales bacterium]
MVVATAVGLVGVLTFHTTPAHLSLGALPGSAAPRSSSTTSSAPVPRPTQAPPASSPPPPPSSTTTVPATTRSATGQAVNYNYGVLSVTVTMSGKTITHVGIASLDDGGNFRSQSIDQQSIPMLEQQAVQAQNANIQGVSGASYTSAGFAQSLQSALGKLGA